MARKTSGRPSATDMLHGALELLHDREAEGAAGEQIIAAQRIVEVYAQAAIAEQLDELNTILDGKR